MRGASTGSREQRRERFYHRFALPSRGVPADGRRFVCTRVPRSLRSGDEVLSPRLTIRDSVRESALLRTRIVVSSVMVVCLALVLVVRLIELQVADYDHFKTLSNSNRIKIVPVTPTRGLIYDRNGVLLAQNVPTFSLEVIPEAVPDMDATLAGLKKVVNIRPADEQHFHELLRKTRRFEYVPLRARLSDAEVARFAVNRYRFPGVDINARLTRDYPLGTLGAHVIGYVGRISEHELQNADPANYRGTDVVGKTGVEQSYEKVLHGLVGYQHVEINAQGRTLRVLERKPPEPGKSLFLTIDASLQAVAENALAGENGAIVAIDPGNGDVLALASVPEFDPNEFVDGIDAAAYHALLNSPGRPLFNRALRGRYPPGSTIKPFVALAGLEDDVDLAHDTIFCPGYYRLKGSTHRYRDWKKWGHGKVDLSTAITQSCDVYFYQLALALGIDRLHDFLARFGFGQKTGIDLDGEVSGINPSSEWKQRVKHQVWFPGETLISGIGQGFTLATPLQLASAVATLATRGVRFKPRVVGRIEDRQAGTQNMLPPAPVEAIQRRDPKHWETVIDAMVQVVSGRHGTARAIGVGAKYLIAGKTGTAQVVGIAQNEEYDDKNVPKELRDNGLFIAFAPAENPRLALAVVYEHGGSGSHSAAPIARKIMDYYLLGDGERKNPLLMTSTGARE